MDLGEKIIFNKPTYMGINNLFTKIKLYYRILYNNTNFLKNKQFLKTKCLYYSI